MIHLTDIELRALLRAVGGILAEYKLFAGLTSPENEAEFYAFQSIEEKIKETMGDGTCGE